MPDMSAMNETIGYTCCDAAALFELFDEPVGTDCPAAKYWG